LERTHVKPLRIRLTGALLLVLAGAARAQAPVAPDSTAVPAPPPVAAPVAAPVPPPPAPVAAPVAPASKAPAAPPIYYGGAIGFSFSSDFFRISLEPLVGYKLNPKLSVGGKLRYEYLNDSRGVISYDSHNFGASVFSNYRLLPQIYAHGEYAYMSYDYPGERQGVPFLLVGGGYSRLLRPNVWLNFEVLWDVLQDSNSPYDDWQPVASVGIGVGF
jgi:hypothetical protein